MTQTIRARTEATSGKGADAVRFASDSIAAWETDGGATAPRAAPRAEARSRDVLNDGLAAAAPPKLPFFDPESEAAIDCLESAADRVAFER